jgi:hypothetical protein
MRKTATNKNRAASQGATRHDACVIEPTPERFAQAALADGKVVRLAGAIRDALEGSGRPWQSLGTLSMMFSRGSITAPMKQAGEKFHDFFRRAALDTLAAGDPQRVPVQCLASSRIWLGNEGSEVARLQIISALDALGGTLSPGGACAWSVLGCEMPLKEWAASMSWSARPVHHNIAAGILIADLGILQAHWELR